MVNVVVGRKRTVQVSANATAGYIDTSIPVTIKNTPILSSSGGGASRLDALTDVVAAGESTGATLIYDAVLDKYIVQKMSFNEVIGDLDGGTF